MQVHATSNILDFSCEVKKYNKFQCPQQSAGLLTFPLVLSDSLPPLSLFWIWGENRWIRLDLRNYKGLQTLIRGVMLDQKEISSGLTFYWYCDQFVGFEKPTIKTWVLLYPLFCVVDVVYLEEALWVETFMWAETLPQSPSWEWECVFEKIYSKRHNEKYITLTLFELLGTIWLINEIKLYNTIIKYT